VYQGHVSRTRCPTLFALLIALFSGAACGRTVAAESGEDPVTTLEEALRWTGEIELEENAEVINVFPRVRMDAGGRFLVADAREVQFRVYDVDGRLATRFGERGGGPGEFRSPVVALRSSTGDILAGDLSGLLVRYDSTGSTVLESTRLPLGPLFDVRPLAGSLLVLAGGLTARSPFLLHIWDTSADSLVRSFFSPPIERGLEAEHHATRAVRIAVRGDTIAALYAHGDTIHLFGRDGEALGTVPVPYVHFRRLSTKHRGGASREAILRWTETFSIATDLFWTPDGGFLVQYNDNRGGELHWRLLRTTRDGRRVFELQDTPRLLAADDAGATLVFVSPGAETPARWSLARLAP
jgi:hypothetical protein